MIDQPLTHQDSRGQIEAESPTVSASPPSPSSPSLFSAPASPPLPRSSPPQTITQKLKSVLPFTRSHSYSIDPLPTEPPSKRGKPAKATIPADISPKSQAAVLSPPASSSPTAKKRTFRRSDIVHDAPYCMFKIKLDSHGSLAALCYLPTQAKAMVEFYHMEIPMAFRHIGIGDALADKAFEWARQSKSLVIPSCPFIHRYLDRQGRSHALQDYVVRDEQEGLRRLESRRAV